MRKALFVVGCVCLACWALVALVAGTNWITRDLQAFLDGAF
jgi:hypothetical protein